MFGLLKVAVTETCCGTASWESDQLDNNVVIFKVIEIRYNLIKYEMMQHSEAQYVAVYSKII